jgi:hypothetical protein
MKPRQSTSAALTDDLLAFLQRKFYQGENDGIHFTKDKRRLLKWVILWPATWLHERGVSVPEEKYREIFMAVMMLALQQGNTGQIKYRPAWLAKVIQSHFDIHGDEIYAAAKSMRSLASTALLAAGKLPVAGQPDITRDLALAAQLISGTKRKPKTALKGAVKQPLNLELNL